MNIAIILAGGVGSRLGADRPKQFVEILGKPVLAYTLEKFQQHTEIDAIEVVCVKPWKSYLEEMIRKYNFTKVKWIADGGATFQESVLNGIFNLEDKISPEDIVMTHFGASPFVEADIISDCIKVCKEKGNAISTTPFFLLSGLVDEGGKSSSVHIDRDTIACMNSPHAFKYSFVNGFYKEAITSGKINEVEPHTTTLMQYMGYTVYFSKGSQGNIKLTTKEDLDLFEGYVLMKQRRATLNNQD